VCATVEAMKRTSLASLALLSAMAAFATAPPDKPEDKVLRLEPPRAIQDFTLTNHLGERVAWSSLRGAPTLVFFGFTHCPDVCPATLAKLKMITTGSGADLRKVRVVLVSVDGDRDTPEAMRKYLAGFSPRFIGLTGPPRQVNEVARRFSAAFFKGQPDGKGGYLVEHTSQVYLVDAKGRMRAAFFNSPTEAMVRVTREVVRART